VVDHDRWGRRAAIRAREGWLLSKLVLQGLIFKYCTDSKVGNVPNFTGCHLICSYRTITWHIHTERQLQLRPEASINSSMKPAATS
jgi:hypothetical protein